MTWLQILLSGIVVIVVILLIILWWLLKSRNTEWITSDKFDEQDSKNLQIIGEYKALK